jgi:PiT family inorganic phosphate transporter
MCLCVGDGPAERVDVGPDGAGVVCATGVALSVGQLASCREEYRGRVFGFDAQRLLDRLHFFSAGMVGFARGLNDTPKMVALLAAGAGLGLTPVSAMLVVSGAMAAGGIVASRRVAGTMSERIVSMNHGQGFIANVVTAFLVVAASRFGVPVSTTHVSCGSLFGLGAVNGTARRGVIRAIVLAWVSTLPLAAVLAAAAVSAQGSGLATAVARMCSRA